MDGIDKKSIDITYNHKLKLEEYDDDGNLIDCVELPQRDLLELYMIKNTNCSNILISKKEIRDYFNSGDIELKDSLLNNVFFQSKLDRNLIDSIEYIIKKYTKDEINFALTIKNYCDDEVTFFLTMKDYNMLKSMNFYEVLKWIRRIDGIYYCVANDGSKGMVYLERPTKKQAKYQRQKNGKRIVFLSFRDWKEYDISENELR
ncbi:MAG: hypothetical protein ACLR3R_18485 [Clostridium paraputrificum]